MVQNKNIELDIILTLIKGESHLREISRNIGESHSTVLRKINELVKDNILDYKQEGKNKIFFIKNNLKSKNYVYSAEIYKLNKLLKKHPKLSILFEEIKKNFKKGIIILFGSYAKGNKKNDSDIDIYLETADNKIKNKIKEINSKLSIKIGEFDTNSLLIKEIIKNHVILRGVEEYYERNNFFKET
ncbi:MAG: nucleotidyltransferase domain-containing protein [Candidatus Portnoybacteria bacterium]|nr:nucleotidyltransferase domain-containing protein [Candidatus Portnoybacteria bacterium]